MNTLRNKSIVRFLIALLTISLGTVIVSPAARAEGNTVKYADWLLIHLPDASMPDVQQAAYLASEDGARSFEEFLTSFQNELESLAGISDQLNADDTQNRATKRLLQELRFMFTRFVGEALLIRRLVAASRPIMTTTQQTDVPDAFAGRVHAAGPDGSSPAGGLDRSDGTASVMFLRSAAQPLGP